MATLTVTSRLCRGLSPCGACRLAAASSAGELVDGGLGDGGEEVDEVAVRIAEQQRLVASRHRGGLVDEVLDEAGDGRRSERTLHPYGLVAHSGRWYVTGADPGIGEDRTFRLDRIADTRILPGLFEPPAGFDPAQHVLSGLAKTPYRHEVTLNIQATIEQIRARLPASVATVEELPPAGGADPQTARWFRVELHAERLDWLPPLLASLDRPFVVERPDELRDLIAALADRLATSAQRATPHL
jgi:predicted DNA-binding transcriptional regulator YafY